MVVKTKSSGVTMLSFSYLGKSCTEKGKLLVLGENNGEEKMKVNVRGEERTNIKM